MRKKIIEILSNETIYKIYICHILNRVKIVKRINKNIKYALTRASSRPEKLDLS